MLSPFAALRLFQVPCSYTSPRQHKLAVPWSGKGFSPAIEIKVGLQEGGGKHRSGRPHPYRVIVSSSLS